MTTKRRIGLDKAASAYKVAMVDEEGLRTAILDTPVGVGTTDLGLLGRNLLRRRGRRPERPVHVRWNGSDGYLVGNVDAYAVGVQRFDFEHLIGDHNEARAVTYGALGLLLGEGQHEVDLLVGLPVPLMTGEGARSMVRRLRGWLHGYHTFHVDGKLVSLAVDEVRAAPQPAGAYFAWGLDGRGRWARPVADLEATVAVCDIGFNTLDLFAISRGNVSARYTGGDTLGMRRAAEMLQATVRRRYDVELSLYRADALLREGQPRLETVEGWQELGGDVAQALGQTAGRVLQEIERTWGNARQFRHLLFTGGGSEALRSELLRQYPAGVVLPDAVTANAVGLARYARRLFK
jgi:hypothetical protein